MSTTLEELVKPPTVSRDTPAGKGLSKAGIAKEPFLSEGTVRSYVSSLVNKLDIDGLAGAAVVALKHRLVN